MQHTPDRCAETLAEAVAREIAAALDIASHEIRPTAALVGDFGAQPWDVLTLQHGLEVQFGITIPASVARSWGSVGDVQTYIAQRCAPMKSFRP